MKWLTYSDMTLSRMNLSTCSLTYSLSFLPLSMIFRCLSAQSSSILLRCLARLAGDISCFSAFSVLVNYESLMVM